MGATFYDPINVYKPVATNIEVVDGPLEFLTVAGVRLHLPFTTRKTVVRLFERRSVSSFADEVRSQTRR